jgi:DNA-binding TFAR19-related protein (PDSD5 family)
LVKPEKAQQVENAILGRAQRGQIGEKVSEDLVIQVCTHGTIHDMLAQPFVNMCGSRM